ncbi:MAG TPA: hypothetical protein VFM73_07730 [Xanthomonadaceae bacterium]|nr:hypothetical protein [Xanthomonadaceae bacterium]
MPDRIPELLADFPLPDDVSLVAPPRYEFNRLIVGFRTLAREEDVAALLDAELEAAGYEISRSLDIGPKRWVFTKAGREGLVDVEQAGNKTLLTINLFLEPAE